MQVQRSGTTASLSEVLDRVLDRGIVIDAWIAVSVAGIRLVEVDTRIVVASIATYVRLAAALAPVRVAAGPLPDDEGHAPDTARPAPRRQRRRQRPGPKPRRFSGGFQCPQGCTFERAEVPATESPTPRVRCPYRRGTECVLGTLA